MRQVRAKPIYVLLVAAVVAMIVMPIARAGASEGPQATASASGKNEGQAFKRQLKTLKRQVKTLSLQVKNLTGQTGPQGQGGGSRSSAQA